MYKFNLSLQHISVLDDIHVRQKYRCIPPSDYDTVKVHIQQNSLNGAKGFSILLPCL